MFNKYVEFVTIIFFLTSLWETVLIFFSLFCEHSFSFAKGLLKLVVVKANRIFNIELLISFCFPLWLCQWLAQPLIIALCSVFCFVKLEGFFFVYAEKVATIFSNKLCSEPNSLDGKGMHLLNISQSSI